MNWNILRRRVFPKNRKIYHFFHQLENSEICLFGPTTGHSFRTKVFPKNGHPCSWSLSEKFLIFNLEMGFFSNFLKKSRNIREFGNFTYLSPQVCQVSAKSKKRFSSSSIIIHHHHDHSLRSRFVSQGCTHRKALYYAHAFLLTSIIHNLQQNH